MYAIRVSKGIWTAERDEVERWLSSGTRRGVRGRGSGAPNLHLFFRELALPFPPFPGLRITAEDWECEAIARVEWVVPEALFKCGVADEYPHRAGQRLIDHETLVQRALGNGWMPSSPRSTDLDPEEDP